jgi:hypothetical protein
MIFKLVVETGWKGKKKKKVVDVVRTPGLRVPKKIGKLL